MADFYPSHSRQKHLKEINTISFGLGILGALGVRFHFNFFSGNIQKFSEIVKIAVIVYCSMVGNFQETTVSSVHFIGASLCFGLGTIYIWIQVRQLCLYCADPLSRCTSPPSWRPPPTPAPSACSGCCWPPWTLSPCSPPPWRPWPRAGSQTRGENESNIIHSSHN